nr:RNA-directed DNA polymerase, eukaryota [Tanacetum cinerariifolium]
MANLEFCDTHNMVAYLQKPEGSEEFHQIVNFLNTSHIRYALIKNPTIYVSLIQQFWKTATTRTLNNKEMEITNAIDGKVKIVTEASVRRRLKLEDSYGISILPNTEIFEQLALMGYVSNSDKLTFQKGHFSPQWRFFIHTILHCLSSKKTAWEQFSSNIETALICLATNRTFNFSKMIFDGMVKNLDNEAASTGVDVRHGGAATTVTSLDAGQGSGNNDKTPFMPYDSPLLRVNTLRSDEERMQHNELMDLVTKLSDRVLALEEDLKQTKKVYGGAYTKLIMKVKKLEKTVKTSQAKRKAKIVVSDEEVDFEDPSKEGRSMIEEIDQDAEVTLVTPTQVLADTARRNVQTYTRRRAVSTGSGRVSTASKMISFAEESVSNACASMPVSTAGMVDKGKGIMEESESAVTKAKRTYGENGLTLRADLGFSRVLLFYLTRTISTSIFMMNFPDSTSFADLWKLCQSYGTVVDVYIPNQRSKAGKRFAFVRFIKVVNVNMLVGNLCTLWIGRMHLQANVVRFERSPLQPSRPAPLVRSAKSAPSFASAVKGILATPLSASPAMVLDESCMVAHDLERFVVGEIKQLSSINNLLMFYQMRVSLTVVWVDVEGVPMNVWSRTTFHKIGSKWGEVLDLEESKDGFFARKRLCIKTNQEDNILEKFKIIVKGKIFVVRAKELFVWSPSFTEVPEKEHCYDEESIVDDGMPQSKLTKHMNLEEESDIEAVSNTFFGDNTDEVGNVANSVHPFIHKETSPNPFNVYELLNKRNKDVDIPGSEPRGYSSRILESAQNVDDQCSPEIQGCGRKQKEGGSILEILEEMIKFIASSRLVEVQLEGFNFTWAHSSASKMRKLDRFLVTDGLLSMFPHISAICLDRHLSDHRPILYREVVMDYGATPFCIFHSWFDLLGFDHMVTQTWNSITLNDNNEMIRFKKKLQILKKEICVWVADQKKNQLHDFKTIVARESIQKAKIQWAVKGDENSKFFHRIINRKRANLAVKGIMIDGEWVDEPNRVKEEFQDYFANRFYDRVLGMVEWFFDHASFSIRCNSSFITLIPKTLDPKTVGDYRPISFIGSLYKVVTKILATRLSTVILELISDVQTAFLPNRQILDGPFIINEFLARCHHKKQRAMVFKVDFAKAYDSIRWNYLEAVFNSFGSPTAEFQFHRGLKQGDPLAPYLFILIMESLHLSFSRVIEAGFFTGFKLDSSTTLSHLLYADDAVFIGKWSCDNLRSIMHTLRCFSLLSRLSINLKKSQLLGVGISASFVQ